MASVVPNDPLPAGRTEPYLQHRTTPTEPSSLDRLLSAIRRKDVAAKNAAFINWTEALCDVDSPGHAAVMEQFDNLSSPVMSEIIRSMDPVLNPELNVTHGLTVAQGHKRFTDVGKLMDSFGVRRHHRDILRGMMVIMELREGNPSSLRPADFNTFLRCAGATMDARLAGVVFGAMSRHNLIPHRTTQTWIEFVKARFIMDPIYYQFDRARVAVHPESFVSGDDIMLDPKMAARMDSVRFSCNAFMREPWNRLPDQPKRDNRSLLRASRDSTKVIQDNRSFWRHMLRQQAYPNEVTEELISTNIIGLSRSNDCDAIINHILGTYYEIEVDKESHTVRGGKDLLPDSPLYPTARLLSALVEAFGSMSQISLGIQLVDFVSQRYNVPIPRQVWSNLLNWAYTCASKKFQSLRKIYSNGDDTYVGAPDIVHIWNIMISEPYNIKPSFEDLDIYVRSLIIMNHMYHAVEVIRESAIPYYDSLTEEFECALFDEILLRDASPLPSTMSSIVHRRRQAETHKDHVSNRISIWLDDLRRETSKVRRLRSGRIATQVIPDLVRDFPHFFPQGVRYRTAWGDLTIRDPDPLAAQSRWDGAYRTFEREVLPADLGRVVVDPGYLDGNGVPRTVRDAETGAQMENPDFEWPEIHPMRVREKRGVPRQRVAEWAPAPKTQGPEKDQWWDSLRTQMMMP